ncbi:hypothetical protein H4582DRAFT_2198016 [Lactarius indigo]|nr:hypothetical protein H4582DRAFT_2198016 [Lactarius indigo]
MRIIYPTRPLSAGFRLAVLLAIVPFISASPSSRADGGPTIAENVGAWYYFGCFSDSAKKKTLSTPISVEGGQDKNTVASCTEACKYAGYGLAGMEAGRECYCGNGIENGGETISCGWKGIIDHWPPIHEVKTSVTYHTPASKPVPGLSEHCRYLEPSTCINIEAQKMTAVRASRARNTASSATLAPLSAGQPTRLSRRTRKESITKAVDKVTRAR